jgi:hypothetical protein
MGAHIFTRPRAAQAARHATPLLEFIAGEFAVAIADEWPAPHGDFFAMPTARRHAAAIILAGHAARGVKPAELRRLVEFQRDPVVAEALAGEDAQGLMRALAKAGETLWTRRQYKTFLGLFAEPMANEVLRHLDEVRPAAFAPLAVLPPALRIAPIVRVLPNEHAASDLARAFALAVRMRRPDVAPGIARRWGAGGDTQQLFRRAQEDMTPDSFRPAGPAPSLQPPFFRITSRKLLEQVALEFRNCLAEHAIRIAEGRMAVYVWRNEPAAAIAISWDAAGWRLSEAKAQDNVDLEESQLRDLVRILGEHGVRTGPSVQTLNNRLDDHAGATGYTTPYGESFIEQLALGDLWS